MSNPIGRPRKELTDLHKGWEQDVLDLAEVGGSDVEIRTLLNISKDVWYAWLDIEGERYESSFTETIKRAGELCETWWTREGRENLKDKDFSYTGWYMNMKNRFGWADKREIKQESKHTHEIKEITQDTAELYKELLKDSNGNTTNKEDN